MNLDIIGDIHGCSWELRVLIEELGYREDEGWAHPEGRRLALLGDIVDRGPDSFGALMLVRELVDANAAFIAAVGNHDYEIYHGLLLDKPTKVFYGLQRTLDQIEEMGAEREFARALREVFDNTAPFTVIKEEKLLLVHAALYPDMLGVRYDSDWSDKNSQFALYGETIHIEGEPFPRKGYSWADSWEEDWTVIYGHDVIGEMPIIRGKNLNVCGIDTGASYGGRLTALRWPEKEMVQVSARDVYPEHKDDFSDEPPGMISRYSWNEIESWKHDNTDTLHYLHGKRKTPEMSIPKIISVEI
jgi:protein phosphatase